MASTCCRTIWSPSPARRATSRGAWARLLPRSTWRRPIPSPPRPSPGACATRARSLHEAAMRAWVLGDDVDTDVIAPGRYMKFGIEEIAKHCLESVRPEFSKEIAPGDIVF